MARWMTKIHRKYQWFNYPDTVRQRLMRLNIVSKLLAFASFNWLLGEYTNSCEIMKRETFTNKFNS